MRFLPAALAGLMSAAALSVATTSCDDTTTNNWDAYEKWRSRNVAYYDSLKFHIEDGRNVYTTLVPSWNSSAEILIRYLNDRKLTEGNLSPLLNSTVDVKYIGRLYNGVAFDSSYTLTTNGDSIFRTGVNTVIAGWTTALQNMRVGDSVEIVIPYTQGYGGAQQGAIPPYSTLVFNVKLVDIPFYEVRP